MTRNIVGETNNTQVSLGEESQKLQEQLYAWHECLSLEQCDI